MNSCFSPLALKMKLVVLLVLGLCGSVLTVQEEYGVGERKYKVSDKLFLERQRDILRLFKYINQPSYYQDHQEIARTFSVEGNIDAYVNSTAVKRFVSFYKQGFLPRGEIFSIFYNPHLEQAISLFKLFYYARDFDTFYKTAVWARNNVNEGLFIYALSTALVHRDDTFEFVLPPIYEVFPYYFFSDKYLQRVQKYKQAYNKQDQAYLVYANYSDPDAAFYFKGEESLLYYLEDVGINSFYYYCNVYYPFWMDGEEFRLKNDRRGEQFYYLYQQFLARYYLERLSNNLGEIEYFDYEEPFVSGYYSSLSYPDGERFPDRFPGKSWTFKGRSREAYSRVRDFETRLRDCVDSGYVFKRDAKIVDLFSSDQTDFLGNLIESNPDSVNPRYYGPWQTYARRLFSHSHVPSALEHYETALRDPAFYQVYKRIVRIFQRYKDYLPSYTYSELSFPGVKLEKLDFDRLYTYFDYFDSDVSNAVEVTREEYQADSFRAKLRQRRLNHKPFTYRISVNSDKVNDAVVRVYLGPKFDEFGRAIPIDENRENFVEVDTFRYKLQAGQNVIERNSRQTYWYVPDRTSFRELYRRVMGAMENTEQFQLDASEAFYGFPNRFLLPKGKRDGQIFQVYVIINPYQAPGRQEVQQKYYFHRVGTGMNYYDNYAFGFPFDRVISSSEFKVPNSQFVDVVIYHKNIDELNSSQAQDE